MHNNDTPDRALQFSNLYSRLLSQPVLDQKWASLYLLYLLSDSNGPSQAQSTRHAPLNERLTNLQIDPRSSRSPSTSRLSAGRQLDDAFSRGGIANLPSPQERRERPARPPPVGRRKETARSNGSLDLKDGGRTGWPDSLEPSEATILRDLPFMLQGVSTTHFAFNSATTMRMPQSLPGPLISLLHALAEPGLLYRGLANFQESADGGLISQSLRSAISDELRAYLGLVASLEGQIRRALTDLDGASSRARLGKAGVTLKRCVIWTRDATMGLRLMSTIVEESRNRKGGQLISLIHSYASSHGDPFVTTFAERLLAHVTRPFYDMLRLWIYDGELADPYLEFFVSEHGTDVEDGGRGGATSVWEDKYKLDKYTIPSIMTEEFAKKIFLIGKSLNFIRHGCGDSAWVDSYSKEASRELQYGDTATLETSIDEAYRTTMARLMHLMNSKFKLSEHLFALKKYLLLSQGDFVALLMESLASNLDRPANTQYRHTLTAQLEHAIRNSNAQHDASDILARLDARMLDLSHGDVGWDVFTLEYKVDAPVDVIVTPASSREYLKVFNFLWRVKRVEFALGITWRRCMTGARGVLGQVNDKVGKDWKTARCAMAEMIHFVVQLQYYILFEVIEASWDQLQKTMATPDCTLDNLIEAHARYLKSITRKGLLGRSHMEFTSQLHELLKIMLAYKDAVDGLYSYSVTESTKRQQRTARIESRTAQGKWGITERDEESSGFDRERDGPRSRDMESPMPPPLLATGMFEDADVLTALRTRLRELTNDFRARVCLFLGDLAYQPDTDLRFLGVTMNWNDTYKISRRGKKRNNDALNAVTPAADVNRGPTTVQADTSLAATTDGRQRR